jgi:hypothetical protein
LNRLASSLLILILLDTVLGAQSLTLRIDGGRLRVNAPRLHFLVGEAFNRLRDGATLRYEFLLSVRTVRNGTVQAQAGEMFAISYDLWEEKFAAAKLGTSPRSISHLTAAAAELWCVENISIPVSAIPANRPVWVRLDYRADNMNASADPPENSGFTLSGLIDIFSRRTRAEPFYGVEEIGPLRLDSLKGK